MQHPYSSLYSVITQPERERLEFLKAVHLRRETPPYWLTLNPRTCTWSHYWTFIALLAFGACLNAVGFLPWWAHLGIMFGYLGALSAWVTLFERGWSRWLAQCRASGKCYHDYLTVLSRRYQVG